MDWLLILKNAVILLIGFVLLVKGADFFVDGSSTVAKIFKIPSIIVGLTIVSMGTSLPELSVSLIASMNGSNEIAISNVVGSNLFNLLVVLGACAVLSPITVDKSVVKREFPFSIIITVVLALLMADNFIPLIPDYIDEEAGDFVGVISRLNGIILAIIFIGFMVYTVLSALKQRKGMEEEEETGKKKNIWISILFIVGGIAAIKFGGDFVVDSAKAIALEFGMTETLVGLTIVAVGTSLPELVTSVVAAKKGETSLAIGNVVGSNIFNILFILGLSCSISPIPVTGEALIDCLVLIAVSVLALVLVKTKNVLDKKEGLAMIIVYVIYMAYAIIR